MLVQKFLNVFNRSPYDVSGVVDTRTQSRNQRGRRRGFAPLKNVLPAWKNVLDIV